jgi:hypothetical protein
MTPTHNDSPAHLMSSTWNLNLPAKPTPRVRGTVREHRVSRIVLVLISGLAIVGHTAIQGADARTNIECSEAFLRSTRAAFAQSPKAPKCSTTGTDRITITCDYSSGPWPGSESVDSPRVALTRAVIAFKPTEEDALHLALTFVKQPLGRPLASRSVYFEIDDDSGHNYVRRLTVVDFSKLADQPSTFSEKMHAPIFPIGHFTIYLWIPDPNPALKFDRAHNLLLNNVGVPDVAKGLNIVADFAVTESKPRMQPR